MKQYGYKKIDTRSGMALLLAILVVACSGVVVVSLFETQTMQRSISRNAIEYERALYLANGGVHHACAELEANNAWRNTVTHGTYPNSGSYSATAVDGSSGYIVITSIGVSGNVTRTVQATIQY